MLLKNMCILLMCAFVVQGTKTGASILKQKKSIDSWNEFYVHYFGTQTSTVLATNWWDLWNFYFFGQFNLPISTNEQNNSNTIVHLTEICDTNNIVEANSTDNIDDEICSTCADELKLKEIKKSEENCNQSENEQKSIFANQRTLEIDVENTNDNTKSDEDINKKYDYLNDSQINSTVISDGNTECLKANISDSTKQKSELFENSNQTLLLDDEESSFVPVKLDELHDFSISDETQNNEEYSIIKDELILTIPDNYLIVTENSSTVNTEEIESKDDSKDDFNMNINESKNIRKLTTTDSMTVVPTNYLSETNFINEESSVHEEHTILTVISDEISITNNDIKEEHLDERSMSKEEEHLKTTKIVNKTSNTIVPMESSVLPIIINDNETQLKDNEPHIAIEYIKENLQTIGNMIEENAGTIEETALCMSDNARLDLSLTDISNEPSLNVQEEILVESLNNNENTESVHTNVKSELVPESINEANSLSILNQDQHNEFKEESILNKDEILETENSTVYSEVGADLGNSSNIDQEFHSNNDICKNDAKKTSSQDSTDVEKNLNFNEGNSIQFENADNIQCVDITQTESYEEIGNSNMELLTSTVNSDIKNEESKERPPMDDSEDNTTGIQTIRNVSEDEINNVIDNDIIGTSSNENTELDAETLDFNNIAGNHDITENNSNKTLENIDTLILTSEHVVVNSHILNSEDSNISQDCSDIGAENSKEKPITYINVESCIETTLLKTEDQAIDFMDPISSNETGIEKAAESSNDFIPEDSKMDLDGSNDTEFELEDSTQNFEAEVSVTQLKSNENISEVSSVQATLLIEIADANNPFEIDSTSNNENGIENTGDSSNNLNLDESNDTEFELEDSTQNFEAEVSVTQLKSNENISEVSSVQATLLIEIADANNPFEIDSTSNNENGIENTGDSSNNLNLDESNDTEFELEDSTQNFEAVVSVTQLKNTNNPFEIDSTSNSEIENTGESSNNFIPEDSKIDLDGSNDTELEGDTKNVEAPKEKPKDIKKQCEMNSIETTLRMTEDIPIGLEETVNLTNQEENIKESLIQNNSPVMTNEQENRFSNETNHNLEIPSPILNPTVAPVLRNNQVPSKGSFLSHFF